MLHENEQNSFDATSTSHRPVNRHARDRIDVTTPGAQTIAAVTEAFGGDVTDLPPLNDVIDLDALDSLFAPRCDGSPRPGGTVSFQYLDHDVTVCANGTVSISHTDE